MKRTIKITQKDINNGLRKHCAYCPIGLALMREFGIKQDDEQIVQVGTIWMYVFPDRKTYTGGPILAKARTPNKAINFILRFDQKKPVKPFQFTVDFEEPTT